MRGQIQSGIYYRDELGFSNKRVSTIGKLPVNSSFALLFLRARRRANARGIGKCLDGLWKMYEELKIGKVAELPNCTIPSGSLSVLIAYGPRAFDLDGIKKQMPLDMKYKQFLPARPGKPILDGSGMKYSVNPCNNLATSNHVAIQIISTTQLATNRAIVETWKHLNAEPEKDQRILRLTAFYNGFKRDDGRSWLGFYDEVSNMRTTEERDGAIRINRMNNRLRREDLWTEHGTYMAFLRIEIDMRKWWKIDTKRQEIIVGRNKLNGFPLLGIDKNHNPITYSGTPKSFHQMELGTFPENSIDHPDYHKLPQPAIGTKSNLDIEKSIKALNESHIGRTRHMDKVQSKSPGSRRIFRQGFDFIEYSSNNPSSLLRVGLNFVSYQNDPGRLLFILTDRNWLGGVDFGGQPGNMSLLSVLASGIFFVPRLSKPFPGSDLFL